MRKSLQDGCGGCKSPNHAECIPAECAFVLAQQEQWDITTVLVVPKSELLLPPVRKQQHSVGARRCSTPSVFAQEKTGKPRTTMFALLHKRFNTDQFLHE